MVKPLKLEDICPKCGRHLIVKEGEHGDFLACPRFPTCKFTKPLPDCDLKIYQPPSPYCEKCNHTGLLPFIKKGNVIPHAFVYCECHNELEHYYPASPEDFDFPCSYSWRAYYEETIFGRYLPTLEQTNEPVLLESEQLEEPWARKQWDIINQLRGMVNFLYSKETERRANASKRKPIDTNKLNILYKGAVDPQNVGEGE